MSHVITVALIVVAVWVLLALAVTLLVGRWLSRAARVPTGPTTYRERAGAAARVAGRLLLLPYVVERTAREQGRAQRRRARRAPAPQTRRPDQPHDQ